MSGYRAIHFALSFFPVYGGMTARIYNLMKQDGNRHTVCVPRSPSRYIPRDLEVNSEEDQYENIEVRRVQLRERVAWKLPGLDYLGERLNLGASAARLQAFMEPCRYDFVYGHGPLEFAMASRGYAARHRLPFIYEVHGLVADNLWTPPRNWKGGYHRAFQRLFRREEGRVLAAAGRVVCQTERMRRRIAEIYGTDGDKFVVLPNGVDAEKFDPERWREQGLQLREKQGWRDKLVVLYAGLFDHINGIDLLLQSLGDVPEGLRDRLRFVLVGRGGLEDQVRQAAATYPWCSFLGMVGYDEIPAYLSACDVFVIPRPSTLPAETLIPMKLLEAMAMEKLVLVSDVGGMAEVVDDGRDGLLYRKGRSQEFLARVVELGQAAELPSALGREARTKVRLRYTWDSARKTLAEVYQSTVESCSRR